MKILLAVDGSEYSKKMLAYLTTHDSLFSRDHAYTVFTAQAALPPRAKAAVGKEIVDQVLRRGKREGAGAGFQVPAAPRHQREEQLESGTRRRSHRQAGRARQI